MLQEDEDLEDWVSSGGEETQEAPMLLPSLLLLPLLLLQPTEENQQQHHHHHHPHQSGLSIGIPSSSSCGCSSWRWSHSLCTLR